MFSSFIISLVGKRLGVVIARYLPYFFVIVGVAIFIWVIYSKGYNNGVEETEDKYQIAIQEERHRQIEANAEALEEARKRQKLLEELLDERQNEIEQLLLEGSKDPDANRRAIGADSVLRINRIR